MKTYTIGRDLGCDIVINDATDVVSRRHATLQVGGVGSRSYGAVRGFGCEKPALPACICSVSVL